MSVSGEPPYVLDAFRHEGLFERAPGYLNLLAEEGGDAHPLVFQSAAEAAEYVRERVAWDALPSYTFRLLPAHITMACEPIAEVRV